MTARPGTAAEAAEPVPAVVPVAQTRRASLTGMFSSSAPPKPVLSSAPPQEKFKPSLGSFFASSTKEEERDGSDSGGGSRDRGSAGSFHILSHRLTSYLDFCKHV